VSFDADPDPCQAAMTEQTVPISLRRYEDRDLPAVRNLFIQVNRELAPARLREAFEGYIMRSLAEEIDRIPEYYAAHGGSFWIVEDADRALVGTFGLETVEAGTAEIRRMYVDPRARRRGIARAMLRQAERICAEAQINRIVLSTSELQPAALALYRAARYRLVREEIATAETNKTVGAGLRRYYFEKQLG
jgi:RimJ/RimL family protein N-acetyltransferase